MANTIMLKNVRLSFLSIFKKAVFEGKEGKYEGTALLDKNDEATHKKVMAAIETCKKENKIKCGADKYFIKDGDDSEYDGYEGHWALKASNNKRPTVLNTDKTPLTEEDEVVYAGCYADVLIEPWAQNNQFGKRINANLLGIRFRKDGAPFSDGGKVASADDFDDVDGEEDEY